MQEFVDVDMCSVKLDRVQKPSYALLVVRPDQATILRDSGVQT